MNRPHQEKTRETDREHAKTTLELLAGRGYAFDAWRGHFTLRVPDKICVFNRNAIQSRLPQESLRT